ncbi:uncharacterized protein F4817DRAFT_353089 [Daldinia loculata]|uniref:uncharacterized protein n=1 Tax=Daldinia loculata TaxID=103429 RepID=UPI0020C5742D|nr:uncharacterized protein F4817DRAFT_353089 [Daldinia loculata]KAI1642392.1 hypothetical protein F4817DRAFT_353089 [Daldinia loculata]
MAKSDKPEEGDKVSWNWGGGAPGGTVAETKEQGAIEIKTQRGNTVKRKADASNPAVRIERSGNDVVKRASELTIDEKKKGGRGSTKRKANGQDPQKYDDEQGEDEEFDVISDGVDEGPHTNNKQGKEVNKGGKATNKKQKKGQQDVSEEETGDDKNKGDIDENEEEGEEAEVEEDEDADYDEVESIEDDDEDDDVEDGKENDKDLDGNTGSNEEKSRSTPKVDGNEKKDTTRQH